MTPAQLLGKLKRNDVAPAYLLLGAEAYERRRVREALLGAALGSESREAGLTRYDLAETPLAEIVDDARSLSLFATRRVIWVSNAEAALPRTRSEEEPDGTDTAPASAGSLAPYLEDPSPGVVLVFDAARYDFEGDDKKKLERVRKFYSDIREVVELRRLSPDDAHAEARALARRLNVSIQPDALGLLVEALGADATRIAVEMEKLALFAEGGRSITAEEIAALVPDARTATIFALVNALGRRDRARSLEILDTLTREGEYLPLALTFLSTQFRMALVARESGLRSPQQIQAHFSKQGVPIWGARAEQVYQTVSKFSGAQLRKAIELIYEADKGLRSTRPDDRVVMERFVLQLTG